MGAWSIVLFHLSKLKFRMELRRAGCRVTRCRAHEAAAYWNERAQTYDAQHGAARDRSPDLEAIIAAPAWNIRRVLELGCGTGSALVQLAGRFPHLEFVGLDLAQAMLQQAEAKARASGRDNLRFVQADLRVADPALLHQVDLIYSRAALQHLAPTVVREVLAAAVHGARLVYLEELHVRGFPDGREIAYPGYAGHLYYSHDYRSILQGLARTHSARYSRGIILYLLCEGVQR